MQRPPFHRIVFLGIVLLLAGCSPRSADPLDWKLEGSDADGMQTWLNANLPLLPAAVAPDLAMSISNIRFKLHGRDANETSNLLARKLEGRTVRDVLIEGNQLGRDELVARLAHVNTNELDLVNQLDKFPAADQPKLQAQLDYYHRAADKLKTQLTGIEAHLATLARVQ
jgi:hypothetical protein